MNNVDAPPTSVWKGWKKLVENNDDSVTTFQEIIIAKVEHDSSGTAEDSSTTDDTAFAGWESHETEKCDYKVPLFNLVTKKLMEVDTDAESTTTDASFSTDSSLIAPSMPGVINRRESSQQFASRKSTISTDISSPEYRVPLDLGWQRELVYRNTLEGVLPSKRQADVYYYAPTRQKLRSLREIMAYLEKTGVTQITERNFTFCKEPLGINDPSKERIRDAKKVALKRPLDQDGYPVMRTSPSKKKKTKADMLAFPVVELSEPESNPQLAVSAAESTSPDTPPARKVRIKQTPRRQMPPVKDLDIGMLPPDWDPSSLGVVTRKVDQGGQLRTFFARPSPKSGTSELTPCSINCQKALGMVPSLQCTKCCCLFHRECQGISAAKAAEKFICRTCKGSSRKSAKAKANAMQLAPANTENIPPSLADTFGRANALQTWMPPSGVSSSTNGTVQSGCSVKPQAVASIGNNRFIVIPKMDREEHVRRIEEKVLAKSLEIAGPPTRLQPSAQSKIVRKSIQQPSVTLPQGAVVLGTVDIVHEGSSTYLVHPKNPSVKFLAPGPTDPEVAPTLVQHTKDNVTQYMFVPWNMLMVPFSGEEEKLPNGVVMCRPEMTANPPNIMGSVCSMYNVLIEVFKYLSLEELAVCSHVCRLWRDISRNHLLWDHVQMSNTHVRNWDIFTLHLQTKRTKSLSLAGLELSSEANELYSYANRLTSLEHVYLNECCSMDIDKITTNCTQLVTLVAPAITDNVISLASISELRNLEQLTLSGVNSLHITNLGAIGNISTLKHLSLKKVANWEHLSSLVNLHNLVSLDIGDVSGLPSDFYAILTNLDQLTRLRLENGSADDGTDFVNVLGSLTHLTALELANFTFGLQFGSEILCLSELQYLKIIIASNGEEDSTSNFNALDAVSRLTLLRQLVVCFKSEHTSRHNGKVAILSEDKFVCMSLEDIREKLSEVLHDCNIQVSHL